MELIERDGFLTALQKEFQRVVAGEGHCVFVSGEAGIGKTSLIKTFCKEVKNRCNIYQGTCDALFTPRPLAPLYDILWQLRKGSPENNDDPSDRTAFFTRFLRELSDQKEVSLIVFEDIHWADEATLDFIKFLARRITRLRCFFILTFRDDDIHSHHPLRNVLGQLNPDSFTRIQLLPLSREAVEKLAGEKGYNGEDVYGISGGNPFYVNEILASYSPGVPDNIKDSILSVFNRHDGVTRQLWEILSIMPTGIEVRYLEKMEPAYAAAVEKCLAGKILVPKNGLIFFKHELYRRTIETSLSPFVRVALNKKILDLFLEDFEQNMETERIIHHAKNANEYELVVHHAPQAAKQAASVGAHLEAAKLYYSAIEYYQGSDKDRLIRFYEPYAYECYLTNRIREAIIYQGKSLRILKEKDDKEKTGDCLRFLSRLWWFDGNRKHAEKYAGEAIELLEDQPSSKAKAMAFSNMAQLKMHSGQTDECIFWGERAIALARELDDEEVLCHALNNVGCVKCKVKSTQEEGLAFLQQSLEIALRNSYHEHAARAFTNLGHNAMEIKNYAYAKKMLAEGVRYCEERDLNAWASYIYYCDSRLKLETGFWNEACRLTGNLIKYEGQARVVRIGALAVEATIKMRKGEPDPLPLLLEAKEKALETMELQRIIPAMVALLEYEWITGGIFIEQGVLDSTIQMVEQLGNVYQANEFAFWLLKARKQLIPLKEIYEGYEVSSIKKAQKAAILWEKAGCPYVQALALFGGDDDDKRKAVTLVHGLGANAVYEKMKGEMKTAGIKSIPRGIRKSTRSNPALLTDREMGVLQLLKEGIPNKEIAGRLFISAKTVDHHISSILFKLEAKSRIKAVQEAIRLEII